MRPPTLQPAVSSPYDAVSFAVTLALLDNLVILCHVTYYFYTEHFIKLKMNNVNGGEKKMEEAEEEELA